MVENKDIEHLKEIIKTLPNNPGVYQYFDDKGVVIYIGKAKNLKKRVSSYFNRPPESGKTQILVKKIANIKFIVVDSEIDALLLENNLIKEYQPRYNILLKDDKSYPWICIKNERFPRVFSTRKIIKDGSFYYGPYTSVKSMYAILELIKTLFPLRNCNFNLSEANIKNDKFSVCLEYHIKNCLGPCEGLQKEEVYYENIRIIKNILKGDIQSIIKYFNSLMLEYASNLEFEKAQEVKDKLALIENYQSKSTIVSASINNVDVFTLVQQDGMSVVNYMNVVNGAIIKAHTTQVKLKLDESPEEILSFAIPMIRERFKSQNKEILVEYLISLPLENVQVLVPKIGDKKKLLELSSKNAKYYLIDQKKQLVNKNPKQHVNRILEQIKKDLHLKDLPIHIECFDNSNFQGTNAVAACVVFKDGKPSNKDYRHFNIKTVDGPDDFASMYEVVYRRYKRLLDEGKNLPQLIVIDGGKGQLSSAVQALRDLNIFGKLAILGIAKKLEELFFPGDPYPLYLDKRSETLKVIQNLRNEAHRFGITHHRNKRSKNSIVSELDLISGVGEKTKTNLLKEFKSVKKIKEASLESLQSVIGKAKGKVVFNYFKNN